MIIQKLIKKIDEKRKKAIRENRNDNEIKAVREDDQKQKKAKCRDSKCKIENAFKAVEDANMVDPVALNIEAYKIIQNDFKNAISEGPTYICDICIEFHFKNNVMNLN